jgi:endonuclease YncB( thermonuclease family)
MPRRLITGLASLLIAAVVAVAQSPYRVERVIDGDTLVISGLGTIRLIGVDTPETVDPRQPVQAFGADGKAFLTGLVTGQVVRVEYDQPLKDRYQRTLAYLYLPDGRMVNREIVRLGYGHAYTEFPFKYLEDFRAAEREARTGNRGVWAAPAVGLVSARAANAASPEQIVYVTRTGTKYHRDGCRSLSQSKSPMSLKEAAARYGPCNSCKPPTLSEAPAAVPAESSAPPRTSAPTTSRRCAAITKAGTQCSRNASPGKAYCWQHGG